jgi:hypothetical protein
MRDVADLISFVRAQPEMIERLNAVASLSLLDGQIAAGFIRNAVWDELHGRKTRPPPDEDVDVLYFDSKHTQREDELAIQRRLHSTRPTARWSVKNQARMHVRNGDDPYRDCCHAMWHWPETATAVSARLERQDVRITAPHGIDDLLSLVVRPTPHFRRKMDIYRARLAAKAWAVRWPRLRFAE